MVVQVGTLILDMDGLMLDTEQLYKRAWQTAAAELGYCLEDALYLTLVGRTNAEGERALSKRFGAEFPVARFRQRWDAVWRAEVDRSGFRSSPDCPRYWT